MKLTYRKGIMSKAIDIAIGVVLLVALVIPFVKMGQEANATPVSLGLPATAWSAILLVVVVIFIFSLIKYKK